VEEITDACHLLKSSPEMGVRRPRRSKQKLSVRGWARASAIVGLMLLRRAPQGWTIQHQGLVFSRLIGPRSRQAGSLRRLLSAGTCVIGPMARAAACSRRGAALATRRRCRTAAGAGLFRPPRWRELS